ncbi:MAG: coproporphyrinogen III oxidase family protein [Desulfobacterota bacterium]|nr:coproporphyrinogen III oxidase family protein [Thermodesulfobacteriota bacterium]MDW8001380.1 coproporphyrinogen III oxidase family protein [Deltaproteobacteria bacterium]
MIREFLITKVARAKIKRLLNFDFAKKVPFGEKKHRLPILMYVHVPFCEELCPYCSFHRFPLERETAKAYFSALRKEILLYRDLGFEFEGVYIGGGTPTVLIDELLETLRLIRSSFKVKEISCETNPNHLKDEYLKLLSGEGVKRLSVGVQSFDDQILKSVKRFHKYGSGKEIIERIYATTGYFQTLNVDMIFNFPNQTLKSLENDIRILNEIPVSQITYYPLMVSSMTRKSMEANLGKLDLRKEKLFYETILKGLSKEFFPATAWCFSKTTGMIDEYVVRYDEYAGLGSGSIGYIDGFAYANTFHLRKYIDGVKKGEIPVEGIRKYTRKERMQYDFLMKLFGLRLNLAELKKKYGRASMFLILPELFFFSALGALKFDRERISLTNCGLYFWVIMMREFFTGVNNFRDFLRNLPQAHAGLS